MGAYPQAQIPHNMPPKAAPKSLNAIQTIYLGWGGKAGPDRLTWGWGPHVIEGEGLAVGTQVKLAHGRN
jgi:hypothetical protein